ncbi:MAG: hypothetical protein M1608_14410 [Candidatus Omnitrophica bacterium]|nr:hypothetical protein [Candidatus Omnitrophota bacterium]
MNPNRAKERCLAAGLGLCAMSLVLVLAAGSFGRVNAFGAEPAKEVTFGKWIWAQLRAFDNTAPGFGAEKYLAQLHFKPDGILLFLVNPDFLFEHQDLSMDAPLSPRYSYYSDPQAQPWTRYKMRGLIEGLHRQGVQVYLSLMGFTDGSHAPVNTEVRSLTQSGQPLYSINPLRRLADGSFYEDVFVNQLEKALLGYGFDGFHAADGLTHLGQPLAYSDYSDDMVSQFLSRASIELPLEMSGKLEGNPNLFRKRATWIWQNERYPWIQFYRERWPVFWRKVLEACHRNHKGLIMNQPLTKDPFEALYRYGFDYRAVAKLGIDALVVETVAGPAQLGGYTPGAEGLGVAEDTELWFDDALAMILTVKAYAPSLRLLFLGCVQDENELWDTLRQAPAFMEKEFFSYPANFYLEGKEAKRCLDGVLFCLGDRLSSEEWQRAITPVERAFSIVSVPTARPSGITAVWSDTVLERQLRKAGQPRFPLQVWLKLLSHEGALVRSIVRSDSLDGLEGPLLAVYPEWMSEAEQGRLQDWLSAQPTTHAAILIGETIRGFASPAIRIQESPAYRPRQCALVVGAGDTFQGITHGVRERLALPEPKTENEPIVLTAKNTKPYFTLKTNEPSSFLERLPYELVSREFASDCAAVLESAAPTTLTVSGAKGFAVEEDADNACLFLVNPKSRYGRAIVRANRPIKRAISLSRFPNRAQINGARQVSAVTPPDGIAVIEIQFGENGGTQPQADHWLAENYAQFPVSIVVTLLEPAAPTQLELTQSDWYSGDYRSGDFAVDLPDTKNNWQEAARGKLPNIGGAAVKVALPGTAIEAFRIRILDSQDTSGAISCGLRQIRLWAGTREISLARAKAQASSTFPGYEVRNILRGNPAAKN